MRKKKPFIPNPDSEDRNIVDLGFESYSNALRRDWSLISFLTNGLGMQTLECMSCKNKSITFEIMSTLPLSLPEPSEMGLNIIVHPLPKKVKALLD